MSSYQHGKETEMTIGDAYEILEPAAHGMGAPKALG